MFQPRFQDSSVYSLERGEGTWDEVADVRYRCSYRRDTCFHESFVELKVQDLKHVNNIIKIQAFSG